MPPTMKTHGHLAALGALGVCAGAFAIWLLLVFISRQTATGGMDFEHSILTWISTGLLFLALIAVHVAFAVQLLTYVKAHRSAK